MTDSEKKPFTKKYIGWFQEVQNRVDKKVVNPDKAHDEDHKHGNTPEVTRFKERLISREKRQKKLEIPTSFIPDSENETPTTPKNN